RLRGDLAADDDRACHRRGLARDAGLGILLDALVEHRVGDLVAELVGVTLGHRLAREEDLIGGHERRRHAPCLAVTRLQDSLLASKSLVARLISMYLPSRSSRTCAAPRSSGRSS